MINVQDFYLTRDYLLSNYITQEEIFSKYFYVPDLSKKYTNPFRTDKTPDCKFYYNKSDKLYFVDHSWGKKHYDCFAVVQELYNCTFSKALQIIYDDLTKDHIDIPLKERVEVDRKLSKGESSLRIARRDYKPKELEFWCRGGLKITQELLEKSGIYAVDIMWEYDYIIEGCYMTFAYVENGAITQIYKPLNKGTNKRRFINRGGLTYSGYDSLDFVASHCIIGKAKKCEFFQRYFDINSFYVLNENIVIEDYMAETLKLQYNGNVFTLFDNDRAGRHLAWLYRKKFGIQPLFVPYGKDFTEYLDIVGEEVIRKDVEKLLNLIE